MARSRYSDSQPIIYATNGHSRLKASGITGDAKHAENAQQERTAAAWTRKHTNQATHTITGAKLGWKAVLGRRASNRKLQHPSVAAAGRIEREIESGWGREGLGMASSMSGRSLSLGASSKARTSIAWGPPACMPAESEQKARPCPLAPSEQVSPLTCSWRCY